jgi:hypothetical protein
LARRQLRFGIATLVEAANEGDMDQRVAIARLNIEHYRRKLAAEKDEGNDRSLV